ncbi:NAD(P)-binding protein [Massilia soli]|uniref:NAD(P)-binding protein n=1 Tax=Massilia soli TaxID=2792854 RepID=A0ABS7SU35_9BURK|nr:NAD(P)-binding protein [Massilia soli]MBZ2209461.1 NAD(P)-binding protein [Massilia soli]
MSNRPAASTQREKIAILGGGIGSLAAAWHLSSVPGWQDRYDITVYQQGWRLGGKGASGRNALHGQRIEEHGLHTLFGFYGNTFALMRAAYDRLGRAPGAPLATWRDAFKAHDYVALADATAVGQRPWRIVFPALPGEPGLGAPVTMWQMAMTLLGWIGRWLDELASLQDVDVQGNGAARSYRLLSALARTMPDDSRKHQLHQHALLAQALDGMRARVRSTWRELSPAGEELRRLRVCLETGSTVLQGLFADGVFINGFDTINGTDLRAWLAKHGGDPELCIDSAPVRAAYDLVFAYQDGDFARPTAEAGTMLRGMLRLMFGYKGSIIFKMQAGMGDTVFTPLYEVLAGRGVKFRFFHRVEELVPDGDDVAAIRMTRQVTLRHGRYNPLVRVRGLDCWPAAPDYAQIDPAQAVLLQEREVDLESYWTSWPELYRRQFGQPLPEVLLERGRDFDKVVFGIPVGSLAALCPRLLAASAPLKAASEQLRTVATQACQVWLDRSLAQAGWTHQPGGQHPVLAGFSQPYGIWAPLDHLLAREDWPPAQQPESVSYFCGTLPMPSYPPQADHGYPARARMLAKEGAIELLAQRIGDLWPSAMQAGGFAWHWLSDPMQREGVARFDAQYWRANVDPSERYVLCAAGTAQYRLASDGAGFANLFLAGDWLKTGLDAGCIEAAVMGGMQASRAICGVPERIDGEVDA